MISPIVKNSPVELINNHIDQDHYRTTLENITLIEEKIDIFNNHGYDVLDGTVFEFNYIVGDSLYKYTNIPYIFLKYVLNLETEAVFLNTFLIGYSHTSEYTLNPYPDTWSNISRYQILSEDFIREFQSSVDWINISQYQVLSEDFIREFDSVVEWHYISRYQVLSDPFIMEYEYTVDWIWIFKYQQISEVLVQNFETFSNILKSEQTTLLINVNLTNRTDDIQFGDNFIIDNVNRYINFKNNYINYLTKTKHQEYLNVLKNTELSFPHPNILSGNDITIFENARIERIDNEDELISDIVESSEIILLPGESPGDDTHTGLTTYENLFKELDAQLTNIKNSNLLYEYRRGETNETDYIIRNHYDICWTMISQYKELQIEFIRKYQNNINWYMISKYQELSDVLEINNNIFSLSHFCYEFKEHLDWFTICRYQRLPESFIREFQDEVHWKNISRYQLLSESFIREFQNRIDWFWINEHQRPISLSFFNEFKHYLTF